MNAIEQKRTLKEIAETITVNWHRIGFNPETEQTDFIATIGGKTFEYHCGLRASVDQKALDKLVTGYKRLDYCTPQYGFYTKISQGRIKAAKNSNHPEVMGVFNDISRLCKPTSFDLISCLVLDSRGVGQSFESWCSDYGYDTDSRKAFSIYEDCQENATKLRQAVGNDLFNELMNAEEE